MEIAFSTHKLGCKGVGFFLMVLQLSWKDKACLYWSVSGWWVAQLWCSRQMLHGLGPLWFLFICFHVVGAANDLERQKITHNLVLRGLACGSLIQETKNKILKYSLDQSGRAGCPDACDFSFKGRRQVQVLRGSSSP